MFSNFSIKGIRMTDSEKYTKYFHLYQEYKRLELEPPEEITSYVVGSGIGGSSGIEFLLAENYKVYDDAIAFKASGKDEYIEIDVDKIVAKDYKIIKIGPDDKVKWNVTSTNTTKEDIIFVKPNITEGPIHIYNDIKDEGEK